MGRGIGRGIRVGGIRREERQDGNLVVGMRGGMVAVGELCSEVGLVKGSMVFFWGGCSYRGLRSGLHATIIPLSKLPNAPILHLSISEENGYTIIIRISGI